MISLIMKLSYGNNYQQPHSFRDSGHRWDQFFDRLLIAATILDTRIDAVRGGARRHNLAPSLPHPLNQLPVLPAPVILADSDKENSSCESES
jgi:hypothetical protein